MPVLKVVFVTKTQESYFYIDYLQRKSVHGFDLMHFEKLRIFVSPSKGAVIISAFWVIEHAQ